MRYMKIIISVIIVPAIVSSMYGCFKEIIETREPLPEIIWPKPPEVPRIRFINSISKPAHLDIRKTLSRRILSFFKGVAEPSIVNPNGVISDDEGRLYVVDNFTKYVHVFDSQNGVYYKFPQKGTSFASPIGITIDIENNIYVSDSERGVIKIFRNYGKEYIKEIGTGFLKRPTGIAVNEKTGELLVVDTANSQIIRYDLDDHTMIGTIGRMGNEEGMFHYPTNIFVSRDGHIFVSDSLNFRVQIFAADGTFLSAFGKAGDSPGYFSRPKGVATDSDGNIYLVDALFDNVQIFDKNGKLLMAFGGPGSKFGKFWLPSGIFIDGNDRIYISDSYNKRVQIFQYIKADQFDN